MIDGLETPTIALFVVVKDVGLTKFLSWKAIKFEKPKFCSGKIS